MIHWITDHLGTSPWSEGLGYCGVRVLDVRDLLDKAGNPTSVIEARIRQGLAYLERGERVVVCCDYGMSRSNAIAAGILASCEQIALEDAVRRVLVATGEDAIKLEVLGTVRDALHQVAPAVTTKQGGRRVLITGASGFIGGPLVAELQGRHEIIAPPRQQIDLLHDVVPLDLLVREHSVDTIVHLANPRVYTTNEAMGTMLVMLKNVLDVCAANRTRLVFLSSWEIYSGYKTTRLVADESLPPCPGGAYGQSKWLCEILVKQHHEHRGLDCTLLRSSPVYGLGADSPKFISTFLQKAIAGEDISTHRYINGLPELDLLHVSDLRSAIAAALERPGLGAVNLGTGIGTSTAEVARQIVEACGSRSRIHQLSVDAYASNIVIGNARASALLDWQPVTSVSQGLQAIVKARKGANCG